MSDQDLFDENKVETPAEGDLTETPAATPDNSAEDLLKSIVNEDGKPKYASAEEALKGAAAAQEHIRRLESEMKELREKGNATEKLDELMAAVKESKGSGQGGENTSTMKPEDVLGIVKEYLSDAEAAKARDNNIKTVTGHFRTKYGKDASEKLYSKAEDLGFSKSEINSMIANNPDAVLRVLGEDKPSARAVDPVASGGSVNPAQFSGQAPAKPETIMGPTSSAKLVDAFAASKRRTLERLGYNPDEVKYQ